jgi:hypothetical protein
MGSAWVFWLCFRRDLRSTKQAFCPASLFCTWRRKEDPSFETSKLYDYFSAMDEIQKAILNVTGVLSSNNLHLLYSKRVQIESLSLRSVQNKARS